MGIQKSVKDSVLSAGAVSLHLIQYIYILELLVYFLIV